MVEVKISSRADLNNVIKELLKIRREGKATSEEIKKLGVDLNKTLGQSAKTTEESIKKSGSVMRRVANQLYSDFKALASLNALEGALKLSNQFQGTVVETIKLSDTIRPKLEAIDYESSDVQITFQCGADIYVCTGVFLKDVEDNAGGIGDEVKATYSAGALRVQDAVGNSALFNIELLLMLILRLCRF